MKGALKMNGKILTILILLCSFSLQAQDVFDPRGKVYGEGFGNTLEEADKNALRELGSSIQTRVSSNVLTQTKNGETIILSNTYTTVSLDIKTSQRFVAPRKKREKFHVYRYIEIEPYISSRMKNYKNLYSLSAKYTDSEVKCGYLYLAYCELDDPTMDAYNSGNTALKKDIETTVKSERINLGGKINFYIYGPNDNLIALDVPYEWKNGIPKPAPKPVSVEHINTETENNSTASYDSNQITTIVVEGDSKKDRRNRNYESEHIIEEYVRTVQNHGDDWGVGCKLKTTSSLSRHHPSRNGFRRINKH